MGINMDFYRNALEQQLFALQHRIENFERALDSLEEYSYSSWQAVNKMSYDAMLQALDEAKAEYEEHQDLLRIAV